MSAPNGEKISKNFLVVSNYTNNLSWVPEYTDNYLIYDRSGAVLSPEIDRSKVISSPNVGYNLYDYFRFIIDHYDSLPEVTIFAKDRCFPRHISQPYFDSVMNNETLTPLMDETQHHPERPTAFIENGLYYEINNSWYFNKYTGKYFSDFNDFLRYVYENPIIPEYIPFAPGGDYIVPKAFILKLPKKLYQDMLFFMSYSAEPVESHIVERVCYTLWTSDQKFSGAMLTQPVKDFVPKLRKKPSVARQAARKIFGTVMTSGLMPESLKKKVTQFLTKKSLAKTAKQNNI